MSVIAREEIYNLDIHGMEYSYKAYVKGSPEMIKSLCLSGSLPANFD
jgi:magnesium-transporting ATPase (P-type)